MADHWSCRGLGLARSIQLHGDLVRLGCLVSGAGDRVAVDSCPPDRAAEVGRYGAGLLRALVLHHLLHAGLPTGAPALADAVGLFPWIVYDALTDLEAEQLVDRGRCGSWVATREARALNIEVEVA